MIRRFKIAGYAGFASVALAALAVTGCGSKEAAAPSSPASTVIFLQANTQSPWEVMYSKQMQDFADQHKNDIALAPIEDAGGDPKKQIQQIDDAITKNPKYLLVSPVDLSVVPELAKARKAGIFTILCDEYDPKSPADTYFVNTTVLAGSMTVTLYNHSYHLSDPILALIHTKGSPNEAAYSSSLIAHAKKDNVPIAATYDVDGSEAGAKAFVADYLAKHKDDAHPIKAIIAINDDMAIGAGEAVQEAHANVPYIFGLGGATQKVVDAVRNGVIYGTFMRGFGGVAALNKILDLRAGGTAAKGNMVGGEFLQKKTLDQSIKTIRIFSDFTAS